MRSVRSRQRSHALGGSDACTQCPIHQRPTLTETDTFSSIDPLVRVHLQAITARIDP